MAKIEISQKIEAPPYRCNDGSSHPADQQPKPCADIVIKIAPAARHPVELTSLRWKNGVSDTPILQITGTATPDMLRDLATLLKTIAKDMKRMAPAAPKVLLPQRFRN